jgi:hypothetical protein
MWVRRLVQGWSWLAVILPVALGVTLLFNPAAMPATAENLVVMVALRNLAFSIVLLVALLTQSGQVVGFLLLARGATDVGDPLANFISTGQLTANVIMPLAGAVLTFACAWYWLKTAGKVAAQK